MSRGPEEAHAGGADAQARAEQRGGAQNAELRVRESREGRGGADGVARSEAAQRAACAEPARGQPPSSNPYLGAWARDARTLRRIAEALQEGRPVRIRGALRRDFAERLRAETLRWSGRTPLGS